MGSDLLLVLDMTALHSCFVHFSHLNSSCVTHVWSQFAMNAWKFPSLQRDRQQHAELLRSSLLTNNWNRIYFFNESSYGWIRSLWPVCFLFTLKTNPVIGIQASAKYEYMGSLLSAASWEQDTCTYIVWTRKPVPGCESPTAESIPLHPTLSVTFLTNPAISDGLVCYSGSFFPTSSILFF